MPSTTPPPQPGCTCTAERKERSSMVGCGRYGSPLLFILLPAEGALGVQQVCSENIQRVQRTLYPKRQTVTVTTVTGGKGNLSKRRVLDVGIPVFSGTTFSLHVVIKTSTL